VASKLIFLAPSLPALYIQLMLKFNPIATEQTTAATDLLLGLLALGLLLGLRRLKTGDYLKQKYWMAMYAFLSCASVLGAVAHGFNMSQTTNYILWYPLYLCLASVIVFFVTGALHESGGRDLSRKAFPWLCMIAFVVYLLTAIPDWFLLFIIYEGVGMLVSLAIFIYLFIYKHNKSGFWMILGIGLTIAAAAAQAFGPFYLRLIWDFDHNGLFHLIQIPGIILIFLGIRNSFQIKMK
jgi:MYXO-CTERM domain-containing protein